MDDPFHFPLYATFIGANLGLASVSFLQRIFQAFAIRWIVVIMNLLIISAISCVFASSIFFKSPHPGNNLSYVAIGILIASYLILLLLSWRVPGRTRQLSQYREFVGNISESATKLL